MMAQIDQLLARGVISPRAADNLIDLAAYVGRKPPGMQPDPGAEIGPRGGPRTYTGASGETVKAPDYGAESVHQPAVRVGDKVYSGNFRSDARRQAAAEGHEPEALSNAEEGFVTNSGRFVDPKEAGRIEVGRGTVKSNGVIRRHGIDENDFWGGFVKDQLAAGRSVKSIARDLGTDETNIQTIINRIGAQ
jgi:hypothetical protein